MWLKLTWVDNRLKIDKEEIPSREMYPSNNPNISVLAVEDMTFLDHIWVPTVYIPHQKLTNCRHGKTFHDTVLNIVLNKQTVWVDFWSLVKPTITCPMSFNWFPFDHQHCFLTIQVCNLKCFFFF